MILIKEVNTLSTKRFKTTIAKSGTRTYIVIPFNPNEIWGVKHRHYVAGSINGCTVRGSFDSDGTQFFLPLGAAWRRGNGLDAGANVEVVIAPEGPQSDTLSPDVVAALNSEPQAKAFFDSLATFYRNTYMRWVESAKRPETRSSRITGMIRLLKAGKKQR